MLVFFGLLLPRLGPDNQVIQTVTVNVADYRIASFLLEKRHPGPFRRVSQIHPSGVEEDVPAVGDVIDVTVLIEISDPGILALSVFFKFDEIGPKFTDFFLTRIEVQTTVTAFLKVYDHVEIAIAVPIVVIETVRAVIVRIGLDYVDPPTIRAGLANVLFPFGFPVVLLLLRKHGVKSQVAQDCKCRANPNKGKRIHSF